MFIFWGWIVFRVVGFIVLGFVVVWYWVECVGEEEDEGYCRIFEISFRKVCSVNEFDVVLLE